MANRLQELGIFSALALMALGSWRAFFQLDLAALKAWVLKPIFLIFGIMVISSQAFYLNFGGNPLYSFFSAREFMLGFMGPGIYLLCRTGLPINVVEKTTLITGGKDELSGARTLDPRLKRALLYRLS